MDGDIAGVRIIPPVIEFLDAESNTIHCQTVTVQNISRCSRQIKFHGPSTNNFKLIVSNPDKPVPPGLEVSASVEYQSAEVGDYQDRLILLVDEDVIEVPISAYAPKPVLELDGPVDFGTVVRNSKVLCKEVCLYNHGSLAGMFNIKYSGREPFTIFPLQGIVKPKTVQTIKVEFVAKKSGRLNEEAAVSLETQEPSTLQLKANVVDRCLELLDPRTGEDVQCMTFGCAYYGTDKTRLTYLYNNGPDPISFVTVLQEDALGTEAGSDLTKSTVATLATKGLDKVKASTCPISTLVKTLPNQGQLGPYQKCPLFFRFSPRYDLCSHGWKGTSSPPPRQDFSLYMSITVVGSNSGFGDGSEPPDNRRESEVTTLEVAITGTALPVLLSLSPQTNLDFGECSVGEHVDTLCSLRNESAILPASFVFQPVAQFAVHPAFGKLRPGEAMDIIFSFKPNQYGTFKKQQVIDVLGSLADEEEGEDGFINPSATIQASIHTLTVSLQGITNAVFKKKEPKFNPGITPLVVGEVGQFVDVKVNEAQAYEPRAAMLGAPRTKNLHSTKSASHIRDDKAQVAYPNDRATSIRPSYRREQYKTIFTKTERHTYVDPDYAYDEEELGDVMAHKNKYNNYLKENREKRVGKSKAKEFKELNNRTEIGIKPASGLKPPRLKADEVYEKPDAPPFSSSDPNDMLSSKKLGELEATSAKRPSSGGLNAVPTTAQEKSDCKKVLSPRQLHQVVIGPPTIDFKEVCLKSTSSYKMNITNNLDQYIHVVVEIDCRELRQTSPLSQVVPPNCQAELPLIFESNNKGKFTRNVKYTINGHHRDHVTVYADVVPVALQLATATLELTPTPGMPAEAGLRDVIRLLNRRNYPAEFTWQPILGERGTAFSIRPATGTVDAFKDLECEVVFHPSYHAPEDGEFALQVHGGETQRLKCVADLGVPQVMFMERRVLFGQVPLHLTTTRTAVLHNNSINHAYFQVVDPNPVPGLNVSPVQGVVPVGGTTELKIHLTPSAVMKFDTRLEVAIRGWKTIDLRMGGTVEPPLVDIDVPSFQLGGVYCGSSLEVPFKLISRVRTRSKVVFDLSRFRDFALKFDADVMEESEDTMNPGVFKVTVGGEQTIHCELRFRPTEVASYDFVIPVSINQTEAPTPDGTPFPPTPAPSSKSIQHIIAPRPVMVTVATPKRRIIATALRQPLQVSTTDLCFTLPSGYLEMGLAGNTQQGQSIMLVNNSARRLQWKLDLRSCGRAMEEGIFRFVRSNGVPFLTFEKGRQEVSEGLDPGEVYCMGCMFCPDEPGEFQAKVPIILDGADDRPYQFLNLYGILKSPQLTFDPLAIVLTPVPLSTKVSADFTIRAAGFRKETVIDVELPEVEVDDGSKVSVLSVTFPDGQTIQPCSADEGHKEPFVLKCKVTFSSPKPVSFTKPIKFVDSVGSRFSIPVTATADNCLLVAYPFLAKHRTDFQIVTEQGHSLRGHKATAVTYNGSTSPASTMGEAVIMPVESPSRPPTHSSTSTSSRFGATTSTCEDTDSITESTYRSTPRDGAVNRVNYGSSAPVYDDSRMGLASRSLGSAAFPDEDSEEGIFHSEVLMSVQRWITLHGWSGGPFPVMVPEGLRSGVSKGSAAEAARDKSSQGSPASNNQKRSYTKTIYDLMAHLSGRLVPGIPINQALPGDPTERVLQLHWQHSTLLTFLRSQGAGVAGIKPEYLFEPQDYQRWMKLQEQVREKKKAQQQGKSTVAITIDEEPLDESLFESVSKRAWTDLLLQTIKVLVLARITPRQFRTLPCPGGSGLPPVNQDPLCSNIYSVGERILLSWLNHHYEHQRHKIWNDCDKGGVPPSRWVVNFDYDLLDGLVLAAVLAAHVPFLITTHLQGMYTHPSTAEQCLHNALKVVTAFRFIGLDYDIQAIDITDPNPISLLLLCQHLYQRLPQYTPKTAVEFTGSLHSTITRQVRLTNPSSKPLTYHAMVAGRDARDFVLPRGSQVLIQPKGKQDLPVEFTSRFLRPAEAVLVLVGRRVGAACGTTLVFKLRTSIDNITPTATIRCESPCYELQKVDLAVVNPFREAGDFRVVLVEARIPFPGSDARQKSLLKNSKSAPKKVRSKTDHGQKKERTPTPPKVEEHSIDRNLFDQDTSNTVGAFYCSENSVHLEGNGSGIVTIDFLPFYTGKRQCSVLFISEAVGEFLYSMEATATLPLPSTLPYVPTKHSVRISSAAAAGNGRGLYGGDDRIIYWRCDSNTILNEELMVPITNSARERALVVAAQQRMSATEIRRRQLTGTLACGSVTAAIAALGLSDDHVIANNPSTVTFNMKPDTKPEGTNFSVEVNSKFFDVPAQFFIRSPLTQKPKSAEDIVKNGHRVQRSPAGLVGSSGVVIDDGVIPLPIRFAPKGAGHYPCRVVLRSPNDIRVYQIECTVNPEGTVAQIEFTAPVHQSVSQEIPIVNQTSIDWPLKATIESVGFHGPPFLLAKAMQTTYYPLMFRPTMESFITGKLLLQNTDDGTEHYFNLQGEGQKPLALDHIVVECKARQKVKRLIRVPNVTSKKMVYKVVSDLPIITGPVSLTVLPGKEEEYAISVSPWKRGKFEGILSFMAGSSHNLRDDPADSDISSNQPDLHHNVMDNGDITSGSKHRPLSGKSSSSTVTSTSLTTGSKVRDETAGYRVWFSLEVRATAPPPERVIAIACAAQSATLMEVEIFNPTREELTFDVEIEGEGLRGDPMVTLKPAQKKYYQLVFAPAIIGKTTGSLIFQNETVGEFWYALNLTAETPAPTTLPHMECELGKWSRQFIPLSNPTEETLELMPSCSNRDNFTLEVDCDRKIILAPHSTEEVPLQFMPSALGQASHTAKITFKCEQLGDWVFIASGTGLTPTPLDPVSISATLGSNTSLIIPFRNPTLENILVNVVLTDNTELAEKASGRLDRNRIREDSAFCLLLKRTVGIPVAPKATLDIPLTFAPDRMSLHEALCLVSIRRETGEPWDYLPPSDPDHPTARRDHDRREKSGGLRDIRWIYPINGIPESRPKADLTSGRAVIACQARSRIEERLEVSLTGAVPSSASGYQMVKTRAVTPKDQLIDVEDEDGVVVGEGNTLASEFTYELLYPTDEAKVQLENAVSLKLIRKQREKLSGNMTLVFNVVYAPFKTMQHDVQLCVKATTGGVWRFPLGFISTEPTVDDQITIESIGLSKQAMVGFRLTSQARHPVAFQAYFVAGSDLEISVSPQTGELKPLGTQGTLITVGFTPRIYGKTYHARLVIQTAEMQWTYQIKGVTPEYTPPPGQATQPIQGPHPNPIKRGRSKNFVLNNLNLTTTAVSSPIKGAPILMKTTSGL